MKRSANKPAGLFLAVLSMRLLAAPPANSAEINLEPEDQAPASSSENSTTPEPKNTRPVKPAREPRSRGSELSFVVGIGVLASSIYRYDTRVSLSGADPLQYIGRQRSPGLAVFGGGALVLPGPLRRITIGGTINAGGPDSRGHPVIPAGISTPFSQQGLTTDIQARYSRRLGWGAAFAPFIEHNVGFFHGGRVRAGYQYWTQLGSHTGSFASADGSSLTSYNVQLSLRSHLLRVSVNEYIALQDDADRSHRSKRRAGMIQQWGIMVGTHQTLMIFAAIGPFWQVAP